MSETPYYLSKTALDAMPFQLPGEGVSKVFTGADPAAHTDAERASEPQQSDPSAIAFWMQALTNAGANVVGLRAPKVTGTAQAQQESFSKKFLYSLLFVVIGLFIISRGFGLIGEEGENVVVNLANPEKFPGIGHAIQGIRKRKK